jgi:hypothetical protein
MSIASTSNPYPVDRPLLHGAWAKGFAAYPQPHLEANPYKYGTGCRIAFLGGWERRRDLENAA